MKLSLFLFLVSTLSHQTHSDDEAEIFTTGLFPLDESDVEELKNSGFLRQMFHPDQEVPENFDAREKWPECDSIREVKNQNKCNSCWGVVLTSVLDDRLCIASNGTKKVRTSAEDFLTCCSYCTDPKIDPELCKRGGNPFDTISYMVTEGVVTGGEFASGIGCKPVSNQTMAGVAPSCVHKCTNPNYTIPYEKDRVFIKAATFLYPASAKQIQIEIFKNGPVLAPIAMTKKVIGILKNKSFTGVYTEPSKSNETHAVRIIGWGTEEEEEGGEILYWLIANSYGKSWGNEGLFKVQRGVNLLKIEKYYVGLITEFGEDPGIAVDGGHHSSTVKISGQLLFWTVFWNVFRMV